MYRTLRRHTHADAADLAIAHVTHRIFVFPADHLTHFFYTTVECAACINLIIICWHQIALFNHVFQADLKAIHLNLVCQLIDRRLDREKSLCRTIATVRADKAECFNTSIQRDRFVS